MSDMVIVDGVRYRPEDAPGAAKAEPEETTEDNDWPAPGPAAWVNPFPNLRLRPLPDPTVAT